MFFYEGYTCPICHQPFQPGDDVVACPDCGLPHHRACWMKEGRCDLHHLHNTPEQWSRDKASTSKATPLQQICPRCQTKNPEFAEICTHCGMLLHPTEEFGSAAETSYHEYRPYSSTPHSSYDTAHNTEELDGINVNDLTAIVSVKTDYYIPRFRRMSRAGRASWNWAAFLLTPYWLLYRKMYAYGTLFLLMQLFESGMMYLIYNTLGITVDMDPSAMMQALESTAANSSVVYYLLSITLFSGILFLIKILVGIFGNRLYQHHCSQTIRRAKRNTPDITAGELATLGGTSMAVAFIGYIVSYFITQVLALLLL